MSIYDFKVKDRKGNEVSLRDYEGKLLLIVNTATGCGFTPHYEPLEAMYKEFREQGFEILDFPCNQFANQAPGTEDEIHQFCTLKFGTEFPQFAKIDVNGENADPLFAYLAAEKPFEGFGKGLMSAAMNKYATMNNKQFGDKAYIKWNFTKFLVSRQGDVIARFEPTVDMKEVRDAVAAELVKRYGERMNMMKIAVRYYTKTGNTKRLAEAIAAAVDAEALPISAPVAEPVDILFLGNSYYAFSIDPEVRSFLQTLDKEKIGRIVNFGSAAMLNSTWKKVKAEADKRGIPMDPREFHCKGEFKGIHKGRPNDEDLKAAAAFAKKIAEE